MVINYKDSEYEMSATFDKYGDVLNVSYELLEGDDILAPEEAEKIVEKDYREFHSEFSEEQYWINSGMQFYHYN